jgi:simple sugar transport system ATP-binding protein
VVFISHKLHEVTTLTDRVTVLRAGELIGTVDTAGTSQADLAKMMVGRETMGVENPGATRSGPVVLEVDGVVAVDNKGLPALQGISLEVHSGEIVGLAGVSGNGQSELAQVLEGTRRVTEGRLSVGGHDLTNADPTEVMRAGVGRIPEDRHASLVGELSVAQNLALEHLDDFTDRGMLDRSRIRQHAVEQIERYQIKARPDDRTRTLSGGNMQKVVLARVLERDPAFIVVSQPTRGLDVGATEYVRAKLLEQRDKGAAILLISEDLDEILGLSDRIAVIYEGKILGVLAAEEANPERLGLLMSGVGV